MKNKKSKMKTLLLITMVSAIIGSFVLFFLGYYKFATYVGGLLIILCTFLSIWTSGKDEDYLPKRKHK
jgi:FtsH-binding integral membrane protein